MGCSGFLRKKGGREGWGSLSGPPPRQGKVVLWRHPRGSAPLFFRKRPKHCITLIKETKLRRRQLEFFFCSALDDTPQALEVALSRLLLNFRRKPLHAVHCAPGRFLEPPSERALQGLNKNHQHEQQNGRRSLRRKQRLQPGTDTPNNAEVKQCQKSRRYGIKKILLPADLQEV